jgi:transcriptional regulator with XRE-family HTH domain
MPAYGAELRALRLTAGLGLRSFAELIDQRASVVSAIEQGLRGAWRLPDLRCRAASVLGIDRGSAAWDRLESAAANTAFPNGEGREFNPSPPTLAGLEEPLQLVHWQTTSPLAASDPSTPTALGQWLQVSTRELTSDGLNDENRAEAPADVSPHPRLTDLQIEWRARRLLGPRDTPAATTAVDVEAALESRGFRLVIIPGLIPRCSVTACVLEGGLGTSLLVVDRIYADSRPVASYRFLLAQLVAPRFLGAGGTWHAPADPVRCQRFAIAALLPAHAVGRAASAAFTDLVEQQGWLPPVEAQHALCNRLASQFSVPPELMHRRLANWPCRVYDRMALALEAQERTLPPSDWLGPAPPWRQQRLFS